jgi:hypothetical protein
MESRLTMRGRMYLLTDFASRHPVNRSDLCCITITDKPPYIIRNETRIGLYRNREVSSG